MRSEKKKNNFFRSFSTDQDRMAPKSLAEQFADLDDPTPKGAFILFIPNSANSACCTPLRIELTFATDFDPEDLEHAGGESDEDGSGDDGDAGREHYQAVG